MVAPLHFNRKRAIEIIDCVENGRAISPPEGGWSQDAMLAVAGVFFMRSALLEFLNYNPPSSLPVQYEHLEARGDTLFNDFLGAVYEHGRMAAIIPDSTYEKQYDPDVFGFIDHKDPDGSVTILAGEK